MSLATSCPSCGTIFKVVEDQLKVSEGWVRCGHCHEVFNALEGLFDLAGRQRPQFSPRPTATGAAMLRRNATPASPGPSTPPPRADQDPADNPTDWIETRPAMFSDVAALRAQQSQREAERLKRLAVQDAALRSTEPDETTGELPGRAPAEGSGPSRPAPLTGPDAQSAEPTPVAPADEPDSTATPLQHAKLPVEETEFIDLGTADTIFQPHEQNTQFGDSLNAYEPPLPPVDDEADARGLDAWRAAAQDSVVQAETAVAPAATLGDPTTATLPTFVRQADRAAWWRKPAVRLLLATGCVLAAAALLLQLALHHRDTLAARWSSLQAPLAAACDQLGCTLQAPRRLEALVVENTALTRPAGVDGYRLQVLLRNRADFAIRAPHLELSLTDSSGAVIVRRVLSPADFRQAEALSASSEGNWQLELVSNDKRIVGYTVAAFYP